MNADDRIDRMKMFLNDRPLRELKTLLRLDFFPIIVQPNDDTGRVSVGVTNTLKVFQGKGQRRPARDWQMQVKFKTFFSKRLRETKFTHVVEKSDIGRSPSVDDHRTTSLHDRGQPPLSGPM